MKKQILFLVVALFAIEISNVFGQAVHNTTATPVSCTNDALHPIAGRSYTYSATGNPAGGNFLWWATQDPNFITTAGGVTSNNSAGRLSVAGGDLNSTSPNYGIPDPQTSVDIVWGSSIIAKTTNSTPTFVAAYYTNTSCADNLKVYEILPINAFTIEIAPMSANATGSTLAFGGTNQTCVSKIESAIYSGGKMIYNYGNNIVYYEVVAANFSDFWTVSLNITGLNAGQSADIDWSYDPTFATGVTAFAAGITTNGNVTGTAKVNVAAGADTKDGVSVYFRLTVHNATYETLADNDIVLAVDGINNAGLKDQTLTCTGDEADWARKATQRLLARPAVTAGTGTGFVTP